MGKSWQKQLANLGTPVLGIFGTGSLIWSNCFISYSWFYLTSFVSFRISLLLTSKIHENILGRKWRQKSKSTKFISYQKTCLAGHLYPVTFVSASTLGIINDLKCWPYFKQNYLLGNFKHQNAEISLLTHQHLRTSSFMFWGGIQH